MTEGELEKQAVLDGAAAGLASLCLLHCLLLPLGLVFAPVLQGLVGGLLDGPAWIHWALIGVAAPVSVHALWRGVAAHQDHRPWKYALAGFAVMALGAIAHGITPYEQMLTLLGGLLVALAHWRNWAARRI